MPIDASIPLAGRPIEVDSPVKAIGQLMQLRDMAGQIQLRQAQTEHANQQALQEKAVTEQKNKDIADQNYIQQAMGSPDNAANIGSGNFDFLNGKVQPKTLEALRTTHAKALEDASKADTAKIALDSAKGQVVSDALAGLQALPDDDAAIAAYPTTLLELKRRGVIPPNAQGIPEAISGKGDLQPLAARLALGNSFNGAVLAKKKEQQQIDTSAAQAQSDLANADLHRAEIPAKQAEAVAIQRQQDAALLAAAAKHGTQALQAATAVLPPDRAQVFAGKTDPNEILQLGMKPQEIVQETHQQNVEKETGRHNTAEEAARRSQLGVEAARLNLERQKFGFEAGGGVSDQAKMIAEGKLDPQTTRAMLRRSPGLMSQVRQIDPNFDEANLDNRFNTLKEFTNKSVGKPGGQLIVLDTLIHHAELYQQVGDALKNGSFTPGNALYNKVASIFGSAPPQNAALVARFLAGETGKVATGGVPAEGEIKGILANLGTSSSPEQIKNAGQKILEIASGRAAPLFSLAKQAKIDNVVQLLSPDAKEILAKRGFDPETMKPVGGTSGAKGHQVGDIVTVNGQKVKIKKIYPDGTFDPE